MCVTELMKILQMRILLFTSSIICQCSEKKRRAPQVFIYLQDGGHEDRQASQNKHKGSSDSLLPETKSKDYQSTTRLHKHTVVFSSSNKIINSPNQCLVKTAKVLVSYVINTSRAAYKLNITIKFSLKLLQ